MENIVWYHEVLWKFRVYHRTETNYIQVCQSCKINNGRGKIYFTIIFMRMCMVLIIKDYKVGNYTFLSKNLNVLFISVSKLEFYVPTCNASPDSFKLWTPNSNSNRNYADLLLDGARSVILLQNMMYPSRDRNWGDFFVINVREKNLYCIITHSMVIITNYMRQKNYYIIIFSVNSILHSSNKIWSLPINCGVP